MHLRQLPAASRAERSADEQLAGEITAYFLGQAPFPERHGFALFHDAPPPTVYAQAWRLEWQEDWCAHALGVVYYDVSPSGEFSTAGAAALLVTQRFVRLMLGAGGPKKPQGIVNATRGNPTESTHLEGLVWRFKELSDLGAGDLLILHHWQYKRLVLRLPWARSMAALIAGLRATERQPTALETGVVTPRRQGKLEATKASKPVLEVAAKLEEAD
jgi:hypothetical protein